jgi:hypothetical protein
VETDKLLLVTTYQKIVSEKELGRSKHDLWQAQMDERLDALYAEIVAAPITTLDGAILKLRFALLCLTQEDDYKEAAVLVQEVCEALARIAVSSDQSAQVA